jgi:hypothetical protein
MSCYGFYNYWHEICLDTTYAREPNIATTDAAIGVTLAPYRSPEHRRRVRARHRGPSARREAQGSLVLGLRSHVTHSTPPPKVRSAIACAPRHLARWLAARRARTRLIILRERDPAQCLTPRDPEFRLV